MTGSNESPRTHIPAQVIGTGRSIDSEFNSRENLPRPRHWHRSWCKTTKKKPLPVFKFSHPRAVWKLFCPLYVSMSRCGKIQVALLLNNAKSDKEVCKKKLQASPVLNTALHTLGLFLAWLHCCCCWVAEQSKWLPPKKSWGQFWVCFVARMCPTSTHTVERSQKHSVEKSLCTQ